MPNSMQAFVAQLATYSNIATATSIKALGNYDLQNEIQIICFTSLNSSSLKSEKMKSLVLDQCTDY